MTSPAATEDEIAAVELRLGVKIPIELREFLKFTNGFEGFFGPEDTGWYLQLCSTAELVEHNEFPGFKEQWPELIVFAGDGGGEGLFFDPTRDGPPILMIGYISNWRDDHIVYASSMSEFFERMHAGYDPFKKPSR